MTLNIDFGSKLSLITFASLCYEGTLSMINARHGTWGVSNVRCCGTEGRGQHAVSPTNEIDHFIVFQGDWIQELRILNATRPPAPRPLPRVRRMQVQLPEEIARTLRPLLDDLGVIAAWSRDGGCKHNFDHCWHRGSDRQGDAGCVHRGSNAAQFHAQHASALAV